MENKLNLYQKLLEIQKRVVGLGKDKKSFGFDYVTGSKVLEHIKPLMNDYGLLLKQEIISFENTRQDYNTKSGSKSEILTKVSIRFTWIDAETGEKDINEFGANGQNDWDKGIGSALTYAERYFLLKFFHIATDEDDIDNPELKAQAEAKAKKELENAIKEVNACQDKDCTIQVWNKYPHLKVVESFKLAVADKGSSFSKAPAPSEKQMELIGKLINSHHIPEDYKERPQPQTSKEASEVIEQLEKYIAEGIEREKAPALEWQVEHISSLLDNDVFSPEETEKGMAKLAKGYTIANANKAIATLEKTIQEREKLLNEV